MMDANLKSVKILFQPVRFTNSTFHNLSINGVKIWFNLERKQKPPTLHQATT